MQTVALLIDDGRKFFELRLVEFDLRKERLRRRLDGGKRRAKLMGNRIQQESAQAITLAGTLCLAEFFHRRGLLNGGCDQAANRFQSLARNVAPNDRQRSD